jgi:hypothetical protein
MAKFPGDREDDFEFDDRSIGEPISLDEDDDEAPGRLGTAAAAVGGALGTGVDAVASVVTGVISRVRRGSGGMGSTGGDRQEPAAEPERPAPPVRQPASAARSGNRASGGRGARKGSASGGRAAKAASAKASAGRRTSAKKGAAKKSAAKKGRAAASRSAKRGGTARKMAGKSAAKKGAATRGGRSASSRKTAKGRRSR